MKLGIQFLEMVDQRKSIQCHNFKKTSSFTNMNFSLLSTKALSKQDGPNVYWDVPFLSPFFQQEADYNKKKKIQKTTMHLKKRLILLILSGL